jgi:mono/diheme cytochrome c family protein/cytochrome c5
MTMFLKIAGLILAVLIALGGAGFLWASSSAQSKLNETYSAHEVELAVPMPLTASELAELGDEASGDAVAALALERAIERGRHLLASRYVCAECHGENLDGGVMVDDPAMGSLLGPNLTMGKGSVTTDYTSADWDRIVRHGIRKDGRPAVMPSEDFVNMSDRELSDIIAYIGSLPPVDNVVPSSTLGPVGKVLLATGNWHLAVHLVADHHKPHAVEAPRAEESVEFGAHVAQVCTGCHRANFEGGTIVQGPPDWAPAKNLSPHEDGLAGWTFEQFDALMRHGVRPDGQPLKEPMTLVPSYAANMTEVEMKALWLYLQSLPGVPNGK